MTQDFQARIFGRIRESIGDLMTDDDLKKLVDASVRKAFFEPVPIMDRSRPASQHRLRSTRSTGTCLRRWRTRLTREPLAAGAAAFSGFLSMNVLATQVLGNDHV